MSKRRRPRGERQAAHRARIARLEERQTTRRRAQELPRLLEKAKQRYLIATLMPYFAVGVPRCVCERCALEQEYLTDPGVDEETGVVEVARCQGFEGIGCGSELALSHEHYLELVA